MPSSCLRVASGGKCSTSSSVAAWEPERKGKGVLGLLLGLSEETALISGFAAFCLTLEFSIMDISLGVMLCLGVVY